MVGIGLSVLAGAVELPVRILPLGDSLTRGNNDSDYRNGQSYSDIPGGYRLALDAALVSAAYPHDFVGSKSDNSAPGMDPDHEGNPGWRTDQILALVPGALAAEPRAVLLLAGTNDVLQRVPVATALGHLETTIDTITGTDPAIRLFVATIPPITQSWKHQGVTTSAAVLNADADSYNAGLRDLVSAKAAAGGRVLLVDLNADLVYTDPQNPANDFYQPGDGIHPGQAGYDQMAALWFAALSASDVFLPAAPSDVNAVALDARHVEVSWGAAADNHTGFEVERREQGATVFDPPVALGAAQLELVDPGLEPETTYEYRISAVNQLGGNAADEIVTVTTGNQDAYDLWTAAYPGFAGLPESSRAPLADANDDGVPNLLAYAFSCDPLAPLPSGAAPSLDASDGLVFRFRRNTVAPDLSWEVLAAPSPAGTWEPAQVTATAVAPVPGESGVEEVAVSLQPSGDVGFFRLRVVRPVPTP
ncbi:MAG: fibronectin type III domain-containing protein [Verrucomicrobiae bacterium]|nr:fibronectin type III domain-containing protein [Verrucomicrobiae bacterium]